VAFLSAIVGSGVAAAAAQAAISAQSQVDMNDSLVDSSISSTKEEGSSFSHPYESDMFFGRLSICFACHVETMIIHKHVDISVQVMC
jgi:hypothetical protein